MNLITASNAIWWWVIDLIVFWFGYAENGNDVIEPGTTGKNRGLQGLTIFKINQTDQVPYPVMEVFKDASVSYYHSKIWLFSMLGSVKPSWDSSIGSWNIQVRVNQYNIFHGI